MSSAVAIKAYKNELTKINTFHVESIDGKPFAIDLKMEAEEFIGILNKYFTNKNSRNLTERKLKLKLKKLGKL